MKSIRTEVTGANNPGEHLPYTRVTAFSLTSLFLERFSREFRISSHKPVSNTKTPENDIFDLLVTFSFPLSHLTFIMRS